MFQDCLLCFITKPRSITSTSRSPIELSELGLAKLSLAYEGEYYNVAMCLKICGSTFLLMIGYPDGCVAANTADTLLDVIHGNCSQEYKHPLCLK